MLGAGGEGTPDRTSTSEGKGAGPGTTWAAARSSDCSGRRKAGGWLCLKWVLSPHRLSSALAKAGTTLAARPCGADLTKRSGLWPPRENHASSPGKQESHVRLTGVEDEPVHKGHEVRPAWRGHRDSLCTLPIPFGAGFHVGNQGSSKTVIWREKHLQETWEEASRDPTVSGVKEAMKCGQELAFLTGEVY